MRRFVASNEIAQQAGSSLRFACTGSGRDSEQLRQRVEGLSERANASRSLNTNDEKLSSELRKGKLRTLVGSRQSHCFWQGFLGAIGGVHWLSLSLWGRRLRRRRVCFRHQGSCGPLLQTESFLPYEASKAPKLPTVKEASQLCFILMEGTFP